MSVILVTGASGAVGAHLSKYLLGAGHEIVSILHDQKPFPVSKILGIHDKINWAHGDLLDETFTKRVVSDYGVNIIYHAAALPLVQVSCRSTTPVFQTNIVGTINLLEAVKENYFAGKPIKFVFISSDKSYGSKGDRPYVESDALGGVSVYDVSKACADLICQTYFISGFAPKIIIARPSNLILPGDGNISRVLPRVIIPAMRGESPVLYHTTYLREFTYIDDMVEALIMLEQLVDDPQYNGEAFNIGSGDQASLNEAVYEVLQYFPGIEPTWTQAPPLSRVEIPFQKLDSSKLMMASSWRPKHSFKEGVKKYVEWTKENWHKLPDTIRNYRAQGWHA